MVKLRNPQRLGPRLAVRGRKSNNPRVQYRLYRTQAYDKYHHNGVQIRVVGEDLVYHYSGSGVSRTVVGDRRGFIHGGTPDLPRLQPNLYLLKFEPNEIPGFDEPDTFLETSEWRELPRDPDVVFTELWTYGAHLVAEGFGYGFRQNSNTVFHDVLFITGGSLDDFDPGDPLGMRNSVRAGANISDQGGRDPLQGWTPNGDEDDEDDAA